MEVGSISVLGRRSWLHKDKQSGVASAIDQISYLIITVDSIARLDIIHKYVCKRYR